MSYYTDSTLSDLPEILTLISLSADPRAMGIRFASQTADADLAQVLADLGADAGPDPIYGWMQFGRDFRAFLDAIQGMEDNQSVAVTIQMDAAGGKLEVNAGGTDVQFP